VATYGAEALAALGDPTRQAIVELLAGGPRAVGDIARQLPVSRPAVSQHLRVLKEAGLVTDRQQGTRRLYQLDPGGAQAVRAYVDRLWSHALTAFKSAVEGDATADRPDDNTRHNDDTRPDNTHNDDEEQA
jgi:DNA-binding transcriptional ArsR family regulator